MNSTVPASKCKEFRLEEATDPLLVRVTQAAIALAKTRIILDKIQKMVFKGYKKDRVQPQASRLC
jgi:hypothetical protein